MKHLLTLLVLAVGARATADQIGTQSTQIAAITADPNWQGGDYHDTGRAPDAGLRIARQFAHLTYRGELDLDDRFANNAQGWTIGTDWGIGPAVASVCASATTGRTRLRGPSSAGR